MAGCQVVHGCGICLHLAWARLSRGYNRWWTLLSHDSLQWLNIHTEQCVRHCVPQCMGVEAWACPQMDQSGKENHNVSGKRWDGSMETAVVGEDFRGKLGLAVGKIWHKRGGYCLLVWTGDGTWSGLGFSPEIPHRHLEVPGRAFTWRLPSLQWQKNGFENKRQLLQLGALPLWAQRILRDRREGPPWSAHPEMPLFDFLGFSLTMEMTKRNFLEGEWGEYF